MNIEHAEVRYFVTPGPFYDADGRRRRELDGTHLVVREMRVGRGSRLRTVASCTSSKAANAARRLLSGECEVKP